jgi:colanic acid biosynthesis protein WcaH
MKTPDPIATLDERVSDPHAGLPEDVFRFVSRMTPMVNVDLLIKDERGRILLAWRDDEFNGPGWHVPGGIVRYKERMEDRVREVAANEIGAAVAFDPEPIALNQVFRPHATRGHFISVLYRCRMPGTYEPANEGLRPGDAGFLRWHDAAPEDLIDVHEMYRKHM